MIIPRRTFQFRVSYLSETSFKSYAILPSKGLDPVLNGPESARSVRHFSFNNGIHYPSGLSTHGVDCLVASAVLSICHSYGHKKTHGLIASTGIHVSQQRISDSLGRVAPGPLMSRQILTYKQLNPIPYIANFYGENLHMDQNEKLVMFRVVHVLGIDGYSRKIVGMVTLPYKNATAIYNTLMRPLFKTLDVAMDHTVMRKWVLQT